ATKAGLKICSLNIKGRGANSIFEATHKWHDVHRVMRNERINVMGIQETHLSTDEVEEINEFYQKTMQVFASAEGEGRTNSTGVAIALNKSITNTADAEAHEIIPGRALMVTIHWHGLLKHAILVTYAPADGHAQNKEFWKTLRKRMRERDLPSPDTHLGDHNMVEDSIDKNPTKEPNSGVLSAFLRFKNEHLLHDGWRSEHPDTKAYTFQSNRGRRSRLDRIYVSKDALKNSHSWFIKKSGIPTDHDMVGYTLTDNKIPFIGKGRWTMPLFLVEDKKLDKAINERGMKISKDIEDATTNRNSALSPQIIWQQGKDDIAAMCREHAKTNVPRIDQAIKEMETKLTTIENDEELSDDEKTISATLLRQELDNLQRMRLGKTRKTAQARFFAEGEEMGKYWTSVNKTKAPREIIYRLRIPDNEGPEFATKSRDMARVARDYHEKLQQEEISANETQAEAIKDVLQFVKRKISDENRQKMAEKVTEDQVRQAIRLAPTDKGAGLDGLPAELWKALDRRHQVSEKETRFNVVKTLTMVYNDIEVNGTVEGSRFAEGWMCPIYKKKAKEDIANYRPITLLNTDYKVYTKALSVKL
ncbi:Endonuclease/exonuclease/phosphatase, partial [Schizophyllum fasciatum]